MSKLDLRVPTFVIEIITKGTIYSNGKTSLVKDTMGEMDAESDCESDSAETDGDAEETRAVLSPGSHSA